MHQLGVELARRGYVDNLEAAAHEQQAERLRIKKIDVVGPGHVARKLAQDDKVEALDVRGRQDQQAAPGQRIGARLDECFRIGQVFDEFEVGDHAHFPERGLFDRFFDDLQAARAATGGKLLGRLNSHHAPERAGLHDHLTKGAETRADVDEKVGCGAVLAAKRDDLGCSRRAFSGAGKMWLFQTLIRFDVA